MSLSTSLSPQLPSSSKKRRLFSETTSSSSSLLSSSTSNKKQKFRGLCFLTAHSPAAEISCDDDHNHHKCQPSPVTIILTINNHFFLPSRTPLPYVKSILQYAWPYFIDPSKLLHRSFAKEAADQIMFKNCVLCNSDCKMLSNVISTFLHSVAVDFFKEGRHRGQLRVRVHISMETVLSCSTDDREALEAAVRQESEAINGESRGKGFFNVEYENFSSSWLGGRRDHADDEDEIEMPECCPMCLNELISFSDGKCIECTECWHVFHSECLGRWLQESLNKDCPLCRFQMVPDR